MADHLQNHSVPLTPTSVEGVHSFFEGLCAIVETIEQGAPASAAIAITPSVLELLERYCGADPRYPRVTANLNVMTREDIVSHRSHANRQKGQSSNSPVSKLTTKATYIWAAFALGGPLLAGLCSGNVAMLGKVLMCMSLGYLLFGLGVERNSTTQTATKN